MRGLLLRLYQVDPDAGASVRLIEYFDELLRNRASLDAIARATAMVAECTAGVRDEQTGHVFRIDLHGIRAPGVTAQVTAERTVLVDGLAVGRVWLEREKSHAFDEMVVERMALTVAARWASRPIPTRRSDPALVELIISESASEEDRHRALLLLGLHPDRPLRVLAAAAEDGRDLTDGVRLVSAGLGRDFALLGRTVVLAARAAILDQSARPPEELREIITRVTEGAGVRVGIGPEVMASRCHESWRGAGIALKFVSVWPRSSGAVAFDELGSLSALAEIPSAVALASQDVQALDRLAARTSGRLDVETLLSFTRDGSLRTAAAKQHMHHSSIANRLRHIERALGITLDDPVGRLRAQTAAILWRLNCVECPLVEPTRASTGRVERPGDRHPET